MKPLAALLLLLVACSSSSAGPAADAGASGNDAGAAAGAGCPNVARSSDGPTIHDADVTEASGIAQSSVNPGVFWIHNDSGDTARAFAIGADGAVLTKITFDAAKPTDIEDIAIENVDGGGSNLYLGDIGDNDLVRKQVVIHRIAEPKLDGTATLTVKSEKMRVTYPDGPHNAETLLFDHTTKDLYIVTKTASTSDVHRVGPFKANGTVTTEKVATLDIVLATGGEISRDGSRIAIRNYTLKGLVWPRQSGESIADAFARPPCTIPIAEETQGEAFAFSPDGKSFATISEGTTPTIHLGFFE